MVLDTGNTGGLCLHGAGSPVSFLFGSLRAGSSLWNQSAAKVTIISVRSSAFSLLPLLRSSSFLTPVLVGGMAGCSSLLLHRSPCHNLREWSLFPLPFNFWHRPVRWSQMCSEQRPEYCLCGWLGFLHFCLQHEMRDVPWVATAPQCKSQNEVYGVKFPQLAPRITA